MSIRRPSLLRLVLAVLVAAVAAVSGGAVTLAATAYGEPPGDTIVEVTGDKANGFTIRHYDGTVLFPPTDSEALAECSEYDTRVARVRCRTRVRVWYRDLGELRQALDWAHAQ